MRKGHIQNFSLTGVTGVTFERHPRPRLDDPFQLDSPSSSKLKEDTWQAIYSPKTLCEPALPTSPLPL